MNYPIVITGCPRSGTGYAAKIFQVNGFKVGHERLSCDGISSWCIAAGGNRKLYGPSYNDVVRRFGKGFKTYHQLRDPISTVSSLMTISKTSRDFANEFIHAPESDSKLVFCMKFWLKWNQMCDKICDEYYWVEQIETKFKFEPYGNKNYNARNHSELTEDDLIKADSLLWHKMVQYCFAHGNNKVGKVLIGMLNAADQI